MQNYSTIGGLQEALKDIRCEIVVCQQSLPCNLPLDYSIRPKF